MTDENQELKAQIIIDDESPATDNIVVDERDDQPQATPTIPSPLPILPLRGLVVFPQTAMPLTVGQPRSLKLVDDVSTSSERIIGLFTARDPQEETPGPEDIYQIGTLAQIHRLFRAPDGTVRLLVQGIARIRIKEFVQTEPYLQ